MFVHTLSLLPEKLNYLQASTEWASAATKSGVWPSETGDQLKNFTSLSMSFSKRTEPSFVLIAESCAKILLQ